METIIKMELPLKRIPAPKRDQFYAMLPRRCRWFGWLYSWGGGSIGEFGGSRTNTIRHLQIFRWHVLTINRNEYHDRSDKERADEYLCKWSECEKELRGLRLLLMGDSTNAEVKKLIRDSLGVDLDEGTIR
jgi:hypothetical protein